MVHISGVAVGRKGVQGFFVLSGYLAYRSLDKDGEPIKYYKKRCARILPSYWFAVLLVYMMDLILELCETGGIDFASGACSWKFLRYPIFLQLIIPSNEWDLWNNRNAFWTMSSFAVFYIIAPWLYKIIKNKVMAVVLLIGSLPMRIMVMNAINYLFSGYPEEAHIEWFSEFFPLSNLYCFLLGFVLCYFEKQKEASTFCVVLAIMLLLTSFKWYPFELFFTIILWILISSDPIANGCFFTEMIRHFSEISFAMYLVHPMVVRTIAGLFKCVNYNIHVLHFIMYVCSIFAAGIFVKIIQTVTVWFDRKKKISREYVRMMSGSFDGENEDFANRRH